MRHCLGLATISASVLILAGTASAQSVISAHSGLIHYVEGQVMLDDKAVEVKYSQFPEVRNDQVLKTEEGRAEVLLTPGVFLRLAENSSFRMLSNKLADTRVEALTGSLMIEHGEVTKDDQVTLIFKDRTISFLKSGLYRLDASTGSLRVYQGEAKVAGQGQAIVAKQSKQVELDAAVLTAMKFDAKSDDDFYRWASRRAGYLAMANVSTAKSLHDSGYYMTSGMWRFNPYFGMFTYIPFSSMYYSPFGYSFYSPYMVSQFYYPRYYGGYYPGYSGNGGGSAYSGRARYNNSSSYSAPQRPSASSASDMSSGRGSSATGGFTNAGSAGGASLGGGSRGGASGAPASGGHSGGGASAAPSGRGR